MLTLSTKGTQTLIGFRLCGIATIYHPQHTLALQRGSIFKSLAAQLIDEGIGVALSYLAGKDKTEDVDFVCLLFCRFISRLGRWGGNSSGSARTCTGP